MRAAIGRLRTLVISGTGNLPAIGINFSGPEMDKLKTEVLSLKFEPYKPE